MKSLYRQFNVDETLTERILGLVQAQDADTTKKEEKTVHTFPTIDGRQVIDGTSDDPFNIPIEQAEKAVSAIDGNITLSEYASVDGDTLSFQPEGLKRLGQRLLPYLAFGVLNGGSATSYIDTKKNSGFYPPLFDLIEDEFNQLAPLCKGRAKGLTPAYINPDGSAGYSFLELKMRALLILELKARKAGIPSAGIPFFQMTSGFTHEQTLSSFLEYKESELLRDLIDETGHDITETLTEQQSLLAAFTPAADGFPRSIFTHAYGKEDSLVAIPGGHGQNFYVLKSIYQRLFDEGKRFAYLVNVDNLGNIPSLSHLAITALTGCDGSFEFSFKSPIDVKGGVLVADETGKLTCKDIGVAISTDEIKAAESAGKPILFNCATGLFNLAYLTEHIDHIIDNLPLRVSEQNKDAGKYSQAEQVTWEIIDLMENPIMLAVNKDERFLAAKLLSESIMTANAGNVVPRLLEANPDYRNFCDVSLSLEKGFLSKMKDAYGMELIDGRWEPIPLEKL